MKGYQAAVAAVGAVAALATWSTASFAQGGTTVVETPPPQTAVVAPTAEKTTGYTGPNRALITTGLVTFGLSYIPAVIVAGTSDNSADHHLYVPIVGPWLDLGNRGGCNAATTNCDTETTNKVLIAVDGVFQGIGIVTTVIGLLTPEHEAVVSTAEANKPKLHVTPAQIGTGYGMAALGTF